MPLNVTRILALGDQTSKPENLIPNLPSGSCLAKDWPKNIDVKKFVSQFVVNRSHYLLCKILPPNSPWEEKCLQEPAIGTFVEQKQLNHSQLWQTRLGSFIELFATVWIILLVILVTIRFQLLRSCQVWYIYSGHVSGKLMGSPIVDYAFCSLMCLLAMDWDTVVHNYNLKEHIAVSLILPSW